MCINMYKLLIRLCLLLLVLLAISGCSKKVVEIVATSWSDDAEEISFLERRYDSTYSGSDNNPKNVEFRIGIVDVNGDNKKYVTGYFERGSRTDRLYDRHELQYKSTAGYHLVRMGDSGSFSVNVDGDLFTDVYEYFIYDVEGNNIHKIVKDPQQYCGLLSHHHPSIRVMPSPSGNLVARVEATVDCELEIAILDYTQNFKTLSSRRITGGSIGGLFWVDDGNLLINACPSTFCPGNWYLIRPEEEGSISINIELFHSLCLAGSIVSSDINSSGEKIDWSNSESKLEIVEVDNYDYTELWSRRNSGTRKPDDPENCVSIETI